MDKHKKKDRYSELMLKIKNSIPEEFYHGSTFIVFALLEDGAESLLKHANIHTIKKDKQNFCYLKS